MSAPVPPGATARHAPPLRATSVTALAVRLVPGEDLRGALEAVVAAQQIAAWAVATCVGSLQAACLRLADESLPDPFPGPFEIVSLVGTFGPDGPHLHLSVADRHGQTRGGHLRLGSPVLTTAEVVLVGLDGLAFTRVPDAATGFDELAVVARRG